MGSFSSLRAKLQLAEWKYASAQAFWSAGFCLESTNTASFQHGHGHGLVWMHLWSRKCFHQAEPAKEADLEHLTKHTGLSWNDEKHPFWKGGEIWSFFLQLKDSKALSQDQFWGGEKQQAHSEQLQNGAPSKFGFLNSVPNFLNILIHSHLICAYWVPSTAFRRCVAKWG